jgi:DNA-binding PadR family transcriptional regulator
MNGSSTGSPFGTRSRPGAGRTGAGLWEAMNQMRGSFERRVGTRMGYQIIRAIEDRSQGMWKPSPGSVYPTLQLLADEGLVTADESAGKKTYSLTDSGRAEAAAAPNRSAPWEMPGMRAAGRASAIPKAGAQLAQAAAQVVQSGSSEQVSEAVAVLDEARRKLYAILAKD